VSQQYLVLFLKRLEAELGGFAVEEVIDQAKIIKKR
jgi:hypothetical protein